MIQYKTEWGLDHVLLMQVLTLHIFGVRKTFVVGGGEGRGGAVLCIVGCFAASLASTS